MGRHRRDEARRRQDVGELTGSRTIAEAVASNLAEAGTQTLFGLPGGGSNLDVIGACERVGIEFVLARGETAAAIMAATYGELTGRPGACVVTRGPGAASAVNGVAQALLDRAPMLIVTDAVSSGDAARVSHQRLDQPALFEPVTKWSVSVGPHGADEVVAAALRVACEAPAGPVHVNVDLDATFELAAPAPASPTSSGDVTRARELVAEARTPVVVVGVGARTVAPALRRALTDVACPVLATYKAKGIVPESAPKAAGFLTGATIEAETLHDADLIIGVGLDPVELIPAPWPYEAPVLSLAAWTADSTYFNPAVEIVGPLDGSLELLQPARGAQRAVGRERFQGDATGARHQG